MAFFHHCLWYFRFKNGVVLRQFNVVEDMVGTVPHSGPGSHLLLRINHIIRTVAQQEFGLYIPCCPGQHKGAPYSFNRAVVSREL